MLGLIPVIGIAFDIVNAVWYFAEGDIFGGVCSLIAVLPVVGDTIGLAGKGIKAAETAASITKAIGHSGNFIMGTYVISNVIAANIQRYVIDKEEFSWKQLFIDAATVGLELLVMRNAVKGIKSSGIFSDEAYSREMFRTADDPMREVMGSAYINDRQKLFDIISELEAKGVEVDISYTNRSMGYQPSASFSGGKPGRIKMDGEASLSAWMHERQHAIDDELSGWNGMGILMNSPNEHYLWEVRAYSVEIDLAKSMNRPDMVDRLEALLEQERRAIFNGN